MKIAFTDMWSPFDPSTNFYVDLLQSIGHTVKVVNPEDCEIFNGDVGGVNDDV